MNLHKKNDLDKEIVFLNVIPGVSLFPPIKTFSPTHKSILPIISYMRMGVSHVIKLSHMNLGLLAY